MNNKVAAFKACATVIFVASIAYSMVYARAIGVIEAQIKSVMNGPQIGDTAPSFSAESTKGKVRFPEQYVGKWVIILSHPTDFAPVCESEFTKIADMYADFEKLNCKFIALSGDSKQMHQRWVNALEKENKLADKLNFPIVSDPNMTIAQKYNMVHPKESLSQTVRSVYFIDPKGVIRAILHYPIANGRNFSEIKRILEAVQMSDRQKVATLTDWSGGNGKTVPVEKESREIRSH